MARIHKNDFKWHKSLFEMIEEVKKLANHYFEDIVKIRRSIHQNRVIF